MKVLLFVLLCFLKERKMPFSMLSHAFHRILLSSSYSIVVSPFNFSEEEEESIDLSTSNRRRKSEGNDSARLSGWIEATTVSSPIAKPQDPLESLLENEEITRFVHEEGGWLEIWEEMKALGWRWVRSRNPLALEAWIHESPCGTKQLRGEEIMSFLRSKVSKPEKKSEEKQEEEQEEGRKEQEEEILISESEEDEEEDELEREFLDPEKRAERIEKRIKEQPLLFSDLWKELTTLGWSWDYGDGLVDVVYLKPSTTKKKGVKGTDLFESEEEVVENVPFLARQVREQVVEAEEEVKKEEVMKYVKEQKFRKKRSKLRKRMHLMESAKKSPQKAQLKGNQAKGGQRKEEEEGEKGEQGEKGEEYGRKKQRTRRSDRKQEKSNRSMVRSISFFFFFSISRSV